MAIQKGRELARHALQVTASDPETIANAVFPLAYFGEDLSAMKALIDNALTLNPSFARAWFLSAHVRLLAGNLELAVEHAETSLHLSPRSAWAANTTLSGWPISLCAGSKRRWPNRLCQSRNILAGQSRCLFWRPHMPMPAASTRHERQ